MNWEQIKNTVLDVLINGGWTLIKVILILVVGFIAIRILKKIIRKTLEKTKIDSLVKKFVYKTFVIILYSLLVLLIVQVLGIEVTGLVAGLTALGLAVGLALKDSLSSLANGVVLIITKPFKENDVVEINGVQGIVKSVKFFSTVIDTWDNKRIVIPNKNMVNYEIVNINYHEKRRFSIKFKVPYGTNIKELREVCVNALLSNEKVYTDPSPALVVKEFSEDGVSVEARAWAPSDDCDGLSFACNELVFNELKKHGFEIAQNKMVVYLEERDKKPYYDNSPLPERDMTKEPVAKDKTNLTFDQVLDGIVLRKIKGKKKEKKPKKGQEKSESFVEKDETK